MGCSASIDSRLVALEHRLGQTEARVRVLEEEKTTKAAPAAGGAAGGSGGQMISGTRTGGGDPALNGGGDKKSEAINLPGTVETKPAAVTVPLKAMDIPPLAALPSAADLLSRKYVYDVFLSHKRTDCADFARTLSTELATVGGLSCFLDQDADFELGDLMLKVRQSRCLVFVLSDAIFKSEWCMLELREALAWKCNIVLLTAHGARWASSEGGPPLHDFPPQNIIPKVVQPAFENKAIEYNRNFHRASVDQLYARIFGRPPRAASVEWSIPQQPNSTHVVQFSQSISSLGLDLPPSNRLQAIQSLTRFKATGEWDTMGVETRVPFHVANEPPKEVDTTTAMVEFVPPTDEQIDPLKPLQLYATSTSPWWQYPDKEYGALTWSGLVVDAPFQSVQTASWTLPPDASTNTTSSSSSGGFVMDGAYDNRTTEKEFRLDFPLGAFPTRPEIFVSLTGWRSHGCTSKSYDRRRISLTPKNIDATGFLLQVSTAGCPSIPVSELRYELDRLSVQYLAFEPRLNRTWVHGSFWAFNPNNDRREVQQRVHFASDCLPSAGVRNEVAQVPKVFVGMSALDSELQGFAFSLSVSEVTLTGCVISWTMMHATNVRKETPSGMLVRWIALPPGESQPAQTYGAHAAL